MTTLFVLGIIAILFLTSVYADPKYLVTLKRVNEQKPLCNSLEDKSIFTFNYNPTYVDLRDKGKKIGDAILVRSQNLTAAPNKVGQSVMTLAKSQSESGLFDDLDNIKLNRLDTSTVVFQPEGRGESYGAEDPRLVYREKDQTYYLFYTAVEQGEGELFARLALATTKNIQDKSSWIRRGPIVPMFRWSKSGALLLRDDTTGPHYLIWGDDMLRMAVTEDLIKYRTFPTPFLKTREDHFDSHLVESGPPPLRMVDGNYLFIYNSARQRPKSVPGDDDLQYNAGWLILDGTNPQIILQRCEDPLLSPELAWEKGESPYLGLVPNVVFIEAAKSLGNNKFLVFYGGADSVVGSAVITVEAVGEDK